LSRVKPAGRSEYQAKPATPRTRSAAHEFEGMKPHQFAHFGAFKATETEFQAATRQTIDFVRMTIEGSGSGTAPCCGATPSQAWPTGQSRQAWICPSILPQPVTSLPLADVLRWEAAFFWDLIGRLLLLDSLCCP
jgi:hypothetical protein